MAEKRLTTVLDLKDRMTRRMNKAINSLRRTQRTTERATESMSRFQRQSQKAGNSFGRFTSSASRSADSLSSSLMGVATAIGSVVGGAKLMEATLGKAMEYEMNRATITAMFQGNNKKAGNYMDMVTQRAIGSPLFSEQDYFKNSKSFLSQSKDVDQLEKMWNLAERLGAMDPAQGLEGATFAMRELFSGSSISMSTRFEMPKKILNEIKKMSLPEQIKALDKQITKMGFGEDFLNQVSETGMSFKNQIQEKIAKTFKDIGLAGLGRVKEQMKSFLDMLNSPAFDKFKAKATDVFVSALDAVFRFTNFVKNNWSDILPVLKAVGVAFGVLAGASIVSGLVSLLNPITAIATAVGALYYAWDQNLGGIQDKTKDVFSFIKPYVMKVFRPVADFLMNKFRQVKEFFITNGDMIKQAFLNVFNFLKEVVLFVMPYVANLIRSIWTNIKGIFSGALDIILGNVKLFASLFTGNWSKAWEAVKQIASGALKALWNVFQLFVLGKILKVAKSVGKKLLDLLGKAFLKLKKFIAPILVSMGESIAGFFAPFIDYMKDAVNMFKKFSGAFKKIGSWIGNTFVINDASQRVTGTGRHAQESMNYHSRAGGMDYVPYDGYPARLHKGERVLTAEENDARRDNSNSVQIDKLADSIVVREEADIQKIAKELAREISQAGGQMA